MKTGTTTRSSPKRRRKKESFILVMLGLTLYLLWINNKYTIGQLSIVKQYLMEQARKTSSTSRLVLSPEQIKSQMEVALSSLLSTITIVHNTTTTTTTTTTRSIWPDTAFEGQEVNAKASLVAAPSTAPTTDRYRPWPKLVFQCGWHADLLSSLVFPNVTRQEYQGFVSLQQLQANQTSSSNTNTNNNSTILKLEEEEAAPPLVVGMHGPCNLNEPKTNAAFKATPRKQMWVHVQRHFPAGKAIFINGESFGDARGHNTYQVGTISRRDSSNDRSLSDFYYMSLAFLELSPTPQQRDAFFDHAKKPKNTGKRGVIYVASNCVNYREDAADRISDVDPENLKIYYGGKCRGQRAAAAAAAITNTVKKADHAKRIASRIGQEKGETSSKLLPVPDKLKGRRQYKANSIAFQQYRYCLVMENTAKSGYITEKIVFAFLGGCVPIYYGTTEVFDIFNKDSFIFYDIKHPELALEQIRYMEKENHTAYDEMLAQPILANGTDTIERYFSLQDDIGGGKLIRRIRAMLGYDPNNPFFQKKTNSL